MFRKFLLYEGKVEWNTEKEPIQSFKTFHEAEYFIRKIQNDPTKCNNEYTVMEWISGRMIIKHKTYSVVEPMRANVDLTSLLS